MRITTNYLNVEDKVVVATSKVESMEAECSQLKKDLIAVMNERNEANKKKKKKSLLRTYMWRRLWSSKRMKRFRLFF